MNKQSTTAAPEPASKASGLLEGFEPISALWEGAGAPYPSRSSADWAMRRLRADLAREGALLRHCRKLYVRLDVFKRVMVRDAQRSLTARYGD